MPLVRAKIEGQGRDARARRESRALAQLTQKLWRSGDGLQSALSSITQSAAEVLHVDRVAVWKSEADHEMRCVQFYRTGSNPGYTPEFHGSMQDTGISAADETPVTRVIRSSQITRSEHGDVTLNDSFVGEAESVIDSPIRVDR